MQTAGQKQVTLAVSATANRSDSATIWGVPSKIGALFNQPLKNSKSLPQKTGWLTNLMNNIELLWSKNDCQAFVGLIGENLGNTTSPK